MDKEYYRVKVVPFKEVNTRVSAEPKMLMQDGEERYLGELPISYHGEGNIADNLYYLYSELSPEEREMFEGIVEEVVVTVPVDFEKKKGKRK